MSRTSAKKELSAEELKRQLLAQGVTVMAKTRSALVEEAPHVYKDVELVASACEHAGLATKVARLRPLGVIKG
jgi:tRNA-splicing ligase RtcB